MIRSRAAILSALVLCCLSSVSSAQPDLSGLSFCIDPGHGPGNANRGPTGLYEHEVNLDVALFLRGYLREANADTVLLTRIDSDPSLSQREDIANRAGVDWFHSIHHNAWNGQQRYTLVLYEELHTSSSSLGPQWPGQADVMSEIMARTIWWALRTSHWRVSGDWSFYGGPNGGWNLGVLNDLTMPGELSEATFHDNPVEEAKLKNPGFRRFEARALYHSFLEYYDAGLIPSGALGGIVYDNDNRAPLNGAMISILETQEVRHTDSNNNGFYSIELLPGQYTIVATATGYVPDTAVVRVPVDSFVFRDFYLSSNIPPTIVATSPRDGDEGVDITRDIRIKFSKKMNESSVEQALSIEPPIEVSYSWPDEGRVLRIGHVQPFAYATQYRVRIDSTAQDEKGLRLDGNGDGVAGDGFELVFTTASREQSRPALVGRWPNDSDTLRTPFGIATACFNKQLDTLTVGVSAMMLFDPFQTPVHGRIVHDVFGDSSCLAFVPDEPLEAGTHYLARTSASLRDIYGMSVGKSYDWSFWVTEEAFSLAILDEFDYVSSYWKDPEWSGSTSGTVPDSTWFMASNERVLFGDASAELHYAFADTGGFIRVFFDDIHDPGATPGKFRPDDILQVYIFGDASGNQFRFCLDDNEAGYEVSDWITIDWYGWRLVTFDPKQDPVHGWVTGDSVINGPTLDLDSFHLRHTGRSRGAIFLDRLSVATRGPSRVEGEETAAVPQTLGLSAAYPNPFNASTSFWVSVPASGDLRVRLVDVLGRVVRTIHDGFVNPGRHKMLWDGKDDAGREAPSGVYVIVAESDGTRVLRKVSLVR